MNSCHNPLPLCLKVNEPPSGGFLMSVDFCVALLNLKLNVTILMGVL